MKCEVCHAPIDHVKRRATKIKYIVTTGTVVAMGLEIGLEWHMMALSTSVLVNLLWIWE